MTLDDRIDFTRRARRGPFEWTPPEGSWTICLFHTYRSESWRRHNIHRRNVNIIDHRAVARFIELTHQRYARELGPRLRDVELFFTDELQLGAVEPWMPN